MRIDPAVGTRRAGEPVRRVHPAPARRRTSHVERVTVPMMILADLLVLLVAGTGAYLIRQWALGPASDLGGTVLDSSVAIAAGWLAAIMLLNGYDRRLLPAGPELFRNVLHASVAAFGIVGAVVYLLDLELSRAFFLAFFLLGPPLLVADRLVLRRVLNSARRHGHLRSAVIAVGPVEHADEIARTIHRESWLGMDIEGVVVPAFQRDTIDTATRAGIPVLGTESELLRVVEETDPDILLFTAGASASAEEFRRTAWALESSDTQVIVVPALTEISAERVRMRPVAGLPLVHMDLPRHRRTATWGKRTFDILGSAAALVLLSPVLAAIALTVSLHDGGPVIFRQQRVGHDGRPFEFLKFRTMVTDAESMQVEMAERRIQDRGNDVMFKMRDDPRITAPGRFLRRYSLDELPQLWNVLRGEMSLIGPRPALPREVAVYTADAHRRHVVRPGITGLWQVSGRSDLSWEDTMRLDLYYVDNWSFTQDLLILVRTVRAVMSSAGAY